MASCGCIDKFFESSLSFPASCVHVVVAPPCSSGIVVVPAVCLFGRPVHIEAPRVCTSFTPSTPGHFIKGSYVYTLSLLS